MGEVLKGNDLWGALEGKKADSKEVVPVKFGEVEGEVTVKFRDLDEIQEIEKEFEDKFPEKPKVQFKGLGKIELPSEKYPKFNDHEKAKEWEKKAKPVKKEKVYRTAYEFIAEDERPSEDAQEGTKILQDRLRYMDAINIVNAGYRLSGLAQQIEEATKNS